MSLPDPSIELPELSQKLVSEQFLEWTELKPEVSESIDRQLDYWKTRLTNSPALELPTNWFRLIVQSFCGESQQFGSSPDLVDGLKVLGRWMA